MTIIDEVPRYSPTQPELLRDPYPTYARYREADPVHWGVATMPSLPGSWYLFGYADNHSMLLDSATFVSDPGTVGKEAAIPAAFSPVAHVFQRWLGGMDPPDHTRLRAIMAKAFTNRRVIEMQPRIEQITTTLLDTALARGDGRLDVVGDLSFPLPMAVIGDAVGVVERDWKALDQWGKAVADAIDRAGDPEAGKAGADAVASMFDHFTELVRERRVRPTDDLLSAMVAAADDDGHPMSEFDAIAIAVELSFAGHETTANGVAKAVIGLMEQRDRWDELRGMSDAGWEAVVEEMLRFTTPVQRQRWRWATKDVRIGDKDVAFGDSVVSILGAANRDPEHFPDPDRIDFNRSGSRHLTFGIGSHFCIGSALARAEMAAALRALVTRVPEMRLAQDPAEIHYHNNYLLPGPSEVRVEF